MLQQYQDGETRNIGGVPYVRQGGQWHAQGASATQPQAAPAQPSAPYVVGTPRPRTPPPQTAPQAAHDQNAVTLDQLRIEREQREAAAGPGAQAAESERKAASFLIRALGANQQYETHAVPPRSVPGQTLANTFPNIAYAEADPQRQVAEDAQNEFIAASLRQDSGAAIPPEEIVNQRNIYFPRPGASPEAMAAARERRARAIEGLLNSGGRSITPELRHAAEGYLQALGRYNAASASPQPAPQLGAAIGAAVPGLATPPGTPPDGLPGPPTGPQAAEGEPSGLVVDVWPGGPPPRERSHANAIWLNAYELAHRRDPSLTWDAFIARNLAPVPQAAPTPDISAERGTPEAQRRAFMENQFNASTPLLGSITQADQALRGPEAANALLHGAQDWASFGTRDEMSAGINALMGLGNYDQNIGQQRAVDAYDNEHHFGDRLSGQIAMGLPEAFLPGSLPAQMARGGAQGLAYGFGSGEGGFAERAPNALLGGGIGVAAPLAFAAGGRAINALRGRAAASVTPEAQAVARAAEQEDVTVSRPIVDPTARPRMARLQASVGGGGPVDTSLAATQQGIENRAGQLAANGNAAEPGVMGQRIQAAANRAHEQAGTAAGRVYDRAAEAAGNAPIHATEAVRVLDQQIADLSANPNTNRALIGYLQTVRGDLVDAAGNPIPKTIAAIRDLRTGLSGEINRRQLGHTNAERLVGQALDAAATDISRDLGSQAPQALRLYNRADRLWRARAENRRQVVERIIGSADNPIGGGDVMARVRSLTAKDTPRLRRLWGMLDPQERLDAAATIAATAGRRSAEEPFSPAQFIAWSRTLSPSARATVFGPEGAQSIENLNLLSRALIDTRSALNNSKSGVVSNWGAFYRQLGAGFVPGGVAGALSGGSSLGTGLAAGAGGAAVAGTGALIRNISARALMSPDMSRWLATGARLTTPQAIRSHIGRLTAIASRDPAIAQEVLAFRQGLLHAMNDNVAGRAAASSDEGQRQQ